MPHEKPGKVLVVDDDPMIRETLRDILEMEGYQVRAAANGQEGLAQLERARPDLVLLDMRMPVLDGWGFAHSLRERRIAVPIVVMTAATDAREWAAQIGANDCLPKPFDLEELLAVVGRLGL